MDFIDYYKILGLSKTASESEIKKAFRKLARQFHPDLHPDDPDAKKRFQEINEAYEVLSDPEKRAKYDKYGKDWKHGEAFEQARQEQERQRASGYQQGFEGFSSDGGQAYGSDFSDFFEAMFGQTAGGSRRQHSGRSHPFKGADFQASLTLPLQQAAQTHQQILEVNGKKVRITIPAGITDGQKIKLSGYGDKGYNGGPDGDLYITFNIPADARYQRQGDDIYISEPLPLLTAVLGGHQEIETLNGKVKITISELTQNESKIRLKGKGFPLYKQEGKFGDLYIKWQVQLPTKLSDEERSLFQKLQSLRS